MPKPKFAQTPGVCAQTEVAVSDGANRGPAGSCVHSPNPYVVVAHKLGGMNEHSLPKTTLALLVAFAATIGVAQTAAATVPVSATVTSPAQHAYYQSMPDMAFETVGAVPGADCVITYPDSSSSGLAACHETTVGTDSYTWNPTTATGWGGSFPDGSYTYELDVYDGGSGTAAYFSPFTLDSTAPVVTITPIAGNSTLQARPTFYYAVTDANADSSFCSYDGGAGVACAQSTSPATPLAPGVHTLTVTHTDLALNTGGSTYQFTVLRPSVTKATPFLSTSKVKSGKLHVPVRWSFEIGSGASTATACSGTVKLSVVPKGMKPVTVSAKLSQEVGSEACQAKAVFVLSKKAKNRKATLSAKFAGGPNLAAFSKSVSGKRL